MTTMTTTNELLATLPANKIYQQGENLYYSVRKHASFDRQIRIYVTRANQLSRLDHLLTPEQLDALGISRTPYGTSTAEGPGGLVLTADNPQHRTSYALVKCIGRMLGTERKPQSI